MKKLWKIIKEKWLIYWQDDEYDISKKHLSQSDKRSLLYGGFMIGMMVVIAFSVVNAINNRKAAKDMEAFLNTVFTYMATATDDEYEEISQTIRHDLIYSPYREDYENLIQYIPNTAESCCLEQKSYPARINLVFPNTGELYGLDIYEKDEIPEEKAQHFETRLTSGYDEISETHLLILKYPSEKSGSVSISQERRIISAQKMKSHFCDDCIRKILDTAKESLVREIFIYDTEEMALYPVEEGELQIDNYLLQIEYETGNYEIEIAYTGE